MEISNCKRISSIFFGRNIFFYFMDDFAKEEALINCCQKRPWLQSIKVYILQKIASPSNFRTCMDVCKCFAQMRKPQKNSSVKMHISLVVSWIPRNSFLLPPLLTRQALGTTIVHNRIGIYSNWVGSRLIRFGSSCHKIKQDFSCPKQSKIAIANCRSSLK